MTYIFTPFKIASIRIYNLCNNPCFRLFVMGRNLASKKNILFLEHAKNSYKKCSSNQISNQKMGYYKGNMIRHFRVLQISPVPWDLQNLSHIFIWRSIERK